MAGEENVLSQAEIDALVSKVPPKPAAPIASAPKPQPTEPVKPIAKLQPSPPRTATASYKKYTSNQVGDLQSTVADLARQVAKLMGAMQRLDQMEGKIAQLSVLLKISPDSTETLKSRFDEISGRLEEIQQNQSNIQNEFQCSKCKSQQLVAVHVKCTNCGDESWMGWWPDSSHK